MKCEYMKIWSINGEEIAMQQKVISLPFKRVSARAIIIRKGDGAILGTLHKHGGKYALPGGSLENGENSLEAFLHGLEEEHIHLIEPNKSLGNAF